VSEGDATQNLRQNSGEEEEQYMILITGANGNLGRRLAEMLVRDHQVRAVVRSDRAASMIATPGVEVRIIDYLDLEAMTEAARGCSHIVHLVGIIKESAAGSFESAHQGTTRVVAEAALAAGVGRVIYLSILGATTASSNACLASKAAGEDILLQGAVPVLVLRVPMVLGEGDYASRALYHRARSAFSVQLRASSLEQPIYGGDVVSAILAAIHLEEGESRSLDLAGPESLTRRALIERATTILGTSTTVVSLPRWVGLAAAWLLERLSANPPFTRAMLGVLDHDDRIDPGAALEVLGLSLTSLNDMLRKCLVESPPA